MAIRGRRGARGGIGGCVACRRRGNSRTGTKNGHSGQELSRSTEAPKEPIRVWRVDRSDTLETYSNGLRVDLTFAERNKPRQPYPVFPLSGGAEPARYQPGPAGIVYHTTESNLADFEEADNGRLKALARNLLEVVKDEHAYHYVIDRFGRVYRVVEETDIANHAGHSVWADPSGIYVNLNSSFLAVSFEGQTGEPGAVTAAQVQAARMLTERCCAQNIFDLPRRTASLHAAGVDQRRPTTTLELIRTGLLSSPSRGRRLARQLRAAPACQKA